jgi:hypothetical protein
MHNLFTRNITQSLQLHLEGWLSYSMAACLRIPYLVPDHPLNTRERETMEAVFILFRPVDMRLVIAGESIWRMDFTPTRYNTALGLLFQVALAKTAILEIEKRFVVFVQSTFLQRK